MAYYQLSPTSQTKEYKSQSRVVATAICASSDGSPCLMVLLQSACIDLFQLATLSHIAHIVVQTNNLPKAGVISASVCGTHILMLTFQQLWLVRLQDILEEHLHQEISQYIARPLVFAGKQAHYCQEFKKLTNKQAKLVRHQQRLCVKLAGRSNQRVHYFFCLTEGEQLIMEESYSAIFKHEYRISVQSFAKDLIVFESYVHKFRPIRLQLITYASHYQSRDTELVQQLQIYQFQERCCVTNVQMIGTDLLCLLTNTHLESMAQSNIILYNVHSQFTIANISMKDFTILQTVATGQSSQQLTYGNFSLMIECLGQEGSQIGLRQVVPFCSLQSSTAFLQPADFYALHPNVLIFTNRRKECLFAHKKVSKKAIYYSWLKEGFNDASNLFSIILSLL